MRGALLLLALGLLFAGCRFERRPDLASSDISFGDSVPPGAQGSPADDSIRAAVAALESALQVGDVSRVAQLTVPGATLIDQEEGVRWSREESIGPLPRPLGAGGAPSWQQTSSRITHLGDAALLVVEYHAAGATGNAAMRATESYLLVRTELGWRLVHLHRSRGEVRAEQPLRGR